MAKGGALWATASRRLARLRREAFARGACAEGRRAWESPPIHPLDEWVLATTGEGDDVPPLLSPSAARALWIRIARAADGTSDPAPLATLASEAWRILRLHDIAEEELEREGGEDSGRFLELARAYGRALADLGVEDAPLRLARAPARLRQRPPSPLPATVWRVGFLALTPVERAVFAALTAAGAAVHDEPTPPPAEPGVVELAGPEEEWRAAGRWFRRRLEERPRALFALVVPDVEERRLPLAGILEDVLEPQGVLAPARPRRRVNVAGGTPLADEPVVATARLLARLALAGLAPPDWSALLLSPYWGAGLGHGRWYDDLVLRRLSPLGVYTPMSLPRVGLDPGGDLLNRLEKIRGHGFMTPEARSLLSWIDGLRRWLADWGWPGPGLDSPAHQARRAHEEVLDALSGASAVLGERLTAADFLFHYEDALGVRLFQPQVRGAGVLVLEPRDVLGLRLDGLWVAGLHAGAWPPAVAVNPFIPVALARRHGLPRCDVPAALSEARDIERAWRGVAPEIVYSSPRREGDLALRPSPLLIGLPPAPVPPPGEDGGLRGAIFARRVHVPRREIPASDPAPLPPQETHLHSGARLLKEQTLCPFRGFAARIAADPLPSFALPLDSRLHGRLLHKSLERLVLEAGGWETGTRERLAARLSAVVAETLAANAEESALDAGFALVEAERLKRLLVRWLDFEETIGGPRRWEAEVPASYTEGVLGLDLRSDRIDRDDDGRGVVLDYKTTVTYERARFNPDGEDPQLWLYALAQRDVAGVGYIVFVGESARIETRLLGAEGTVWAKDQNYTPVKDWSDTLTRWRTEVNRLLEAIRQGTATLEPRKGEGTCRTCPYPILCRKNELLLAPSPAPETEAS
ncbi:MAG: PD-(D/E)XK nuclease family protein [Gammaproteobacteria bacterium]|jgi:probable DNA repair protein|nr:PD-(D/E)XK nuclease family protein [Gammaproteobacteria bacterium]